MEQPLVRIVTSSRWTMGLGRSLDEAVQVAIDVARNTGDRSIPWDMCGVKSMIDAGVLKVRES